MECLTIKTTRLYILSVIECQEVSLFLTNFIRLVYNGGGVKANEARQQCNMQKKVYCNFDQLTHYLTSDVQGSYDLFNHISIFDIGLLSVVSLF